MKAVLQSVSMDVLLQATLSGAGVCLLPEYLVRPYMQQSSLVHI